MKYFLLLLLSLTVAMAVEPFTMVVKTDNVSPGSANNQFTLPLYSGAAYNFTVDWGDGMVEPITNSANKTHTYTNAGTKIIRITENVVGGFPQIYFNLGDDRDKLLQVSRWGGGKWLSFEGAFSGCKNLTITATDAATALTGAVTNFSGAWVICSSLTSFPLLNTAAGTDFSNAWGNCTGLTHFPALNLENILFGGGCFQSDFLTPDSYSALLIGLAANNFNVGIWFDGGNSMYNASAIAARNTLVIDRGWTITDGGLITAPVITSDLIAPGIAGTTFHYQIVGSNMPTRFSAAGLPSGLSINTESGVITGTPTAGTFTVTIDATNAGGTGTASLTIAISATAGAPAITSPLTASGVVGTAFLYQIVGSNAPTGFNALPLPNGLTVNTSTGAITGIPTTVTDTHVMLTVTNAIGSGSATMTITINAANDHGNASTPGSRCGLGSGLSALLFSLFTLLELRRRR